MLKDVLDRLDAKTAGVASLVVFIFALVVLILAHSGRNTYTRDFLNDYLGVSSTVSNEVASQLDRQTAETDRLIQSGYGHTFEFSDAPTPNNNHVLLFYSLPQQHVYLIARCSYRLTNASTLDSDSTLVPLTVTIDDNTHVPLKVPANCPYDEPVTTLLPGAPGIGLHMHTLKITLDRPRLSGHMAVDVLVLVSNGER
jgi:hypothetical protein